jgi:hypothetical protein
MYLYINQNPKIMNTLYNIILKTCKSFALLLLFMSIPQLSKANHLVGADMEYESIGKDSFLVRVSVYRNCNESNVSTSPIYFKAECGGSRISAGGKLISTTDVTPFCKSACTSCTDKNCSYGFGVQKVILESLVDVSLINCCKFTFSYDQCCRSSAITTGGANQNFYTEVMVDKCAAGMHNSPKFIAAPLTILQLNQCVSKVQSAEGNNGDSLVYKLVNPLTAAGTELLYSLGYEANAPFRYAGYPEKEKAFTNPTCYGFHFNQHTGELNFKPVLEEASILVIEVEQWHKDSAGIYQKIGTARRETTVSITNIKQNRTPVIGDNITENKTIYVCAGNTLDLKIQSFDADNNDSVKIGWKTEIKNAVITKIPGQFAGLDFSWKTTQNDIRTEPYLLFISANDGACPLPSETQNIYKIYVLDGKQPKVKIIKNQIYCNTYIFKANADSAADKLEYKWFINGSLSSNDSVLKKTFLNTGMQNIKLVTKLGCENYYLDSVFIESTPGIQNKQFAFICAGDTLTKTAIGGHIYKWTSAQKIVGDNTSASVQLAPLKSAFYFVEITDTVLHCTKKDSMFVNVSTDCVWPGDANKDGFVNYKDLLEIGVGYNVKGLKRVNATNIWQPSMVENWYENTASGINYKHLDCNGDGQINALDTLVIYENYGKSHPSDFKNPVSASDYKLYFTFLKDTFYAGEKAEAELHLGDENSTVNNVYGLAYQYAFSGNKMVTGSNNFTPLCDVLCQNNTMILQSMHSNSATNTGDVTQVKTNQQNVDAANGKLADFSFTLEDSTHNYSPNGEWIYISIKESKLIDAKGKEYSLTAVNDSALVLRKKAVHIGIKDLQSISEQIHIYPNPANNLLTIENPKHFLSKVYIVNPLGQQVKTFTIPQQNKITLNITDLPEGFYFIHIYSGEKMLTEKLIITR